MQVIEFSIKGPKLIEPRVHGDARGFFVERYREDFFREIGINTHFVQDNYSRSQARVLRGLHFQYDKPQAKLVTVTRGAIFDVAVDIRRDSPTFGAVVTVELNGDKPSWFWVPHGFAHGFCVLSPDGADVMYKVDAYYNPQGESGIMWNDPALEIAWPLRDPVVSARDTQLSSWSAYRSQPRF